MRDFDRIYYHASLGGSVRRESGTAALNDAVVVVDDDRVASVVVLNFVRIRIRMKKMVSAVLLF